MNKINAKILISMITASFSLSCAMTPPNQYYSSNTSDSSNNSSPYKNTSDSQDTASYSASPANSNTPATTPPQTETGPSSSNPSISCSFESPQPVSQGSNIYSISLTISGSTTISSVTYTMSRNDYTTYLGSSSVAPYKANFNPLNFTVGQWTLTAHVMDNSGYSYPSLCSGEITINYHY